MTTSTEVILGLAVLVVFGPFIAPTYRIPRALWRHRAELPAAIRDTRGVGARYLTTLAHRLDERRRRDAEVWDEPTLTETEGRMSP